MGLFERIRTEGHEEVVFFSHPPTGLRAIVAIHSTVLGPSLGGVRARPYPSEAEALDDVLRLSRAMSWKAALAGLQLGGGKAVIVSDRAGLTEEGIRAFGRFVHGLSGRYIASIDMNTSSREIDWMAMETPHVAGRSVERGGLGAPGPVTAWGAFHGLRAAALDGLGAEDLHGVTVAVQGLGSVGWGLCEHLHAAGARLKVCDVDVARVSAAVAAFGAEAISVGTFVATEADVLAPCAVGGVIGAADVDALRCKVVAGAANNILVDEVADGRRCARRGVLVAPDFVVNAGGLVAMDIERRGGTIADAMAASERIFDNTASVLSRARLEGITPIEAAVQLARERVEAAAEPLPSLPPLTSPAA